MSVGAVLPKPHKSGLPRAIAVTIQSIAYRCLYHGDSCCLAARSCWSGLCTGDVQFPCTLPDTVVAGRSILPASADSLLCLHTSAYVIASCYSNQMLQDSANCVIAGLLPWRAGRLPQSGLADAVAYKVFSLCNQPFFCHPRRYCGSLGVIFGLVRMSHV
jgi:hypothetical protein